jgi:hypothetical protein
MCVGKDVRIHGYFSRPKGGPRASKSGEHCTELGGCVI